MNRKKITTPVLLITALGMLLSACGSTGSENTSIQSASSEEPKQSAEASVPAVSTESDKTTGSTLVVCFSCTGNTRAAAQTIARVTNGTFYEITPAQSYTDADLDYNDNKSRTTIEQNDKSVRPEINGTVENWEQYDTVFLGYPIWWGEEPRILDTFAEHYDFSGKTVIPFCTSGVSDIGQSGKNLMVLAGGSGTWLDGKRLDSSISEQDISSWLTDLGVN